MCASNKIELSGVEILGVMAILELTFLLAPAIDMEVAKTNTNFLKFSDSC